MNVLLVEFGAGLTRGGMVLRRYRPLNPTH
jgi:hypothetical protein